MELYRLFDAEGTLLYVGISHSAIARYAQHKERQPWIKSVARIQIEDLESMGRQEALDHERQCILTEKPKHNVVHNRPPRSSQRSRTDDRDRSEAAAVLNTARLFEAIPDELRDSPLL